MAYGYELADEELIEMDRNYLIHGLGYDPTIIVKSSGSTFIDSQGNEILDMFSSLAGATQIGHSHPRIVATIKDMLDRQMHTLASFVTPPRALLAKKVSEIAPGDMKDNCLSIFATTGCEALEQAIKMAVQTTGKREIVSTYHSFHGAGLGTMSLTGQSFARNYKVPYPGLHGTSQIPTAYCYRCSFGHEYPECDTECARILDEHVRYGTYGEVAAFVREPIPGNPGHQIPPKEYYDMIREICDEHEIWLIMDEHQTGFGRCGEWFASDLFGLTPDAVIGSKGFGGGLPLTTTTVRRDSIPEETLEDFQNELWHAFTHGSDPLLCAVGCTTIDIIRDEKLLEKARRQGRDVVKRLEGMKDEMPIIGDIRAAGLFIGIELVKDRKTRERADMEALEVSQQCLKKGVLLGLSELLGSVGNVIKLKPPLVIGDDELERGLSVLEESLREVSKETAVREKE